MGQTIVEKIWEKHEIARSSAGESLVYIDRHFVDETCFFCFDSLRAMGRGVRHPDLTVGLADHIVPTRNREAGIPGVERRGAVERLLRECEEWGLRVFGPQHAAQGIVHVVAPELGITLPGLLVACSDSHTPTHGGVGALGFGVGLSDSTHILATQTAWLFRPKVMRIVLHGRLPYGVLAKDLALHLIRVIGANGATGHAIEFTGEAVHALSIEARMTLCNQSVEAGARTAIFEPDETTLAYVRDKPEAPSGTVLTLAETEWDRLRSDSDAEYDVEVQLCLNSVKPHVTWGTSPQDAAGIDERVPDPALAPNARERDRMVAAMEYMKIKAGEPLEGLSVDRAFIGSCTNSRLEDLRAAANVLRGETVRVPTMVVPGSSSVKRAAEEEGVARVFQDAGCEWLDAGCSMCVAMNGDIVPPGERCASTSNRNFVGRQGPGSRTHLMSPTMAAAAAVHGRLIDVGKLASWQKEDHDDPGDTNRGCGGPP